MRGLHVDVAIVSARFRQQAAQLDHLPRQRIPVSPRLLGLMQQYATHNLWHRAKNLR
jgi:hypothetical protein